MAIVGTSVESVTFSAPWKAYNGYTLFVPVGAKDVWLINMQGDVVHHWDVPYAAATDAVLLPGGSLLYAGRADDGPLTDLPGCGGILLEVDWNGNVGWEYRDPFLHHSFFRLGNGRTMVLKRVPVPKQLAARVKGGIPGTERDGVMWSDAVQEIAPSGRVLWEWIAYEHLDPESDVICPLGHRDEWTQGTAVSLFPNGDILVSFCRVNTVAIIDKGNGEIRWKWGASRAVVRNSRGLWSAGHELTHQNDASVTSHRTVLVFDNGLHPSNFDFGYSRILEIDPGSRRVVWSFQNSHWAAFYSSIMGGCERLPNGNTLISESTKGRIFEMTRNHEVVWEYVSPYYYNIPSFARTNMIFKVHRYGPDYEGLRGRNPSPD